MIEKSTEYFDPIEMLNSVNNKPGVYIFLDHKDQVLYVGKALSLKKRLSSYFRNSRLSAKTQVMVNKIARVDIQQTRTDSEALLLESNLIKARRPHYNISLRDDKSFPYIRLNPQDEFPRFSFYRGNRHKSEVYYGPYPNAAAVREMLTQLHKIFRLRQCENAIFRHRSRPCLQYQIRRCSAPCVGLIDREQYLDDIHQAKSMLAGQDQKLMSELTAKMEQAATELNYERAALYRDRIALLQHIRENQYISGTRNNVDLVVLSINSGKVCFGVFQIRHGRNLGGRYFIKKLPLDDSKAALLTAFLPQHYLERLIAPEILISDAINDPQLIQSLLSTNCGHAVKIRTNVRSYRARWLESCQLNTDAYLCRHLSQRSQVKALFIALASKLSLDEVPSTIECFDISHTQGECTVASCVVFDHSGALKSAYRRFNITGINPGDDYSAMAQVVSRRYRRIIKNEGKLPDLILIDGGKGQLGVVKSTLEELQPNHPVLLVGVAKGEKRKAGKERLYLPDRSHAVILDATSMASHLVQRIRDEAHRFAIVGHRAKRARSLNESSLQQIPGIGAKRRRVVLRYFGGLKAIRRAGIEELGQVPGISPTLAQRIYDRFHD